MNLPFAAALAIHVTAGTLAVAAGLPPILAAKGRGGVHERFGRLFRDVMVAVLGSAAVLTVLGRNPYFAALTVMASLLVFSGLRVLRRKRPDLDPAQRATPLDWLVTAGLLLAALALLALAAQGRVRANPAVIWSLAGGAAFYTAYDLLRFARPAGWPFFSDLWFYEHLVKMLGAYGAVVSAFSGSVALRVLPDPWKQLWATIFFQLLTLAFILRHALKRRRVRNREPRPA